MSTNQVADAAGMQRALASAIHEHWGLFLTEGIILVILGLIAIVLPPLATITVTILIGWLFLISGIVGLVTTFMMRQAPGFWWSLLSGILGVGAGIVLLLWPISGALSLTLLLSAFFIVEGVASIMYAVDHRNQLTGRWGWMLVSGIVDLDPGRHHHRRTSRNGRMGVGPAGGDQHAVRRHRADRHGVRRAQSGLGRSARRDFVTQGAPVAQARRECHPAGRTDRCRTASVQTGRT